MSEKILVVSEKKLIEWFKWFIFVNWTHTILGSNDSNGSNGSFLLTGLTLFLVQMVQIVQMVQMVHFC